MADLWRSFGRIGLLSFGGPAAQIGLMHQELVDRRGWLSDRAFADALAFCMVLPGPEAMQLATYCGWRLRGVSGGLLAGGLFVLPGAVVIACLALVYGRLDDQGWAVAALLGIKAAVIAIVLQALWGLIRRTMTGGAQIRMAVAAFAALWLLQVPFPVVIAFAAAVGWLRSATAPASKLTSKLTSTLAHKTAAETVTPSADTVPHTPVNTLRTVVLWGALWLLPLPVLALTGQDLLWDLAVFFGSLAVVTFGGAYAVLAYMAQQVVGHHGWLSAPQMVDALGLAETTPGPLILVTQFVGMTAGLTSGGPLLALIAGGLTLWMTFVPCFLWIFAGAPYIAVIATRPRLRAALDMVAAAVVGVIVNLSLWFAIHVLFQTVETMQIGPLHLLVPHLGSLNIPALGLVGLAFGLGLWWRWPPVRLIPAMAVAGVGGMGFVALVSP